MKSIGLKLWLGMMSLVAFMLLLLWLFQIVFLENYYTTMKITDVRESAQNVLRLFELHYKDFEKNMDALSYDDNLSVEVWDSKNFLVFVSGISGANGQMPMGRNIAKLEAQAEVLMGKEVSIPMTHPRFGNKFILIGLPLKLSTGEIYGVMITMPLAPVRDTVDILKKQLIIITLILLVCTMTLSYFLSRSFTRPILKIIKVAESISNGNFAEKATVKSQDEIGTLGKTINTMSLELSKIETLRRDLISNVSHELRTPLSLIQGYAETIRDVTGDIPQKRNNQLSIIIEESERLSSIVDDILNLSQLQAGNITLNQTSFNVKETLSNVVKRYTLLSEKVRISIHYETDDSEFWVTGDEKRIEQVLFNLINNAFNHTPCGGTISIQTVSIEGFLKVEVSDTGEGISPEDIPHIWDRYYKSYNDHSKKNVGTGLGLSIVKNILDSHHAEFGVNSNLGEGTTFWFALKKA